MLRIIAAALLAPAVVFSSGALASCGAAFCTVNTDWGAQGAWTERGARYGLRFEYVDQDQPRTGTRNLAVGEIPRHHDEVRTINRNWVASVDYGFDERWSVSAVLPIVDRSHAHIHNHMGAQIHDSWNVTEAGDLRLLARYRFAPHQSGLNFGLKLPTGRTDVRNASGDEAERTLQPGTGTTDLLLGAFTQQSLPAKDLSWFVQGLAQLPLDKRDEYRPGQRLSLDAGLRYQAGENLGLMVQVNFLLRGRDKGANAETEDSGGRSLWLSPGASYALGRDWEAYAFLQRAVYQHVNGVQLVADTAVALGVNGRF
jgi:outer membrane putative beta-barrel porin/alpha-amylase